MFRPLKAIFRLNIKQNIYIIIILNNLQQHVSALKSHLQAEYKAVYIYIYN